MKFHEEEDLTKMKKREVEKAELSDKAIRQKNKLNQIIRIFHIGKNIRKRISEVIKKIIESKPVLVSAKDTKIAKKTKCDYPSLLACWKIVR